MKISQYRDIQLIEKDEKNYLAIACDVSAGIGPRKGDMIPLSYELAGYFATIVPMMELICIGAKAFSVVDTLSVERQPSGEAVIKGIKKAMMSAKIPDFCLTGSTEDNISTNVTSIGITIMAEVHKSTLDQYHPRIGQWVYVAGIPKVGQRFLEEEVHGKMGETMNLEAVIKLRESNDIGHILPVGSRGVMGEIESLIEIVNQGSPDCQCHFVMEGQPFTKFKERDSAGPSTCIIFTADTEDIAIFKQIIKQPILRLGRLGTSEKG